MLVFAGLLWRRARLPTDSLPAEIGVGLTSGMLSTGTGMSGPPLVILLGELAFRRVDHERFRAIVLVLLVASACSRWSAR